MHIVRGVTYDLSIYGLKPCSSCVQRFDCLVRVRFDKRLDDPIKKQIIYITKNNQAKIAKSLLCDSEKDMPCGEINSRIVDYSGREIQFEYENGLKIGSVAYSFSVDKNRVIRLLKYDINTGEIDVGHED